MSSRRPISWVTLSLIGALSLLMGVLAGSSLLFPRYEAQAVIGLMALAGKAPAVKAAVMDFPVDSVTSNSHDRL